MVGEIVFTAPDIIIGAGVCGLYGFLYKIDNGNRKGRAKLFERLDVLATEVTCLKALHLQHHPEDEKIMKELCKEGAAT